HRGEHRGDGTGVRFGLWPGDGDPSEAASRRRSVRQSDPYSRLGRLHVDRAPLLARLPSAREQPRGAAFRLRAAPPQVRASRRSPPRRSQAEVLVSGSALRVFVGNSRLLLRSTPAHADHGARGARARRGARADPPVRSQAWGRLRPSSRRQPGGAAAGRRTMKRAFVAAALWLSVTAAGADRDWSLSSRWSHQRTPKDGPPRSIG